MEDVTKPHDSLIWAQRANNMQDTHLRDSLSDTQNPEQTSQQPSVAEDDLILSLLLSQMLSTSLRLIHLKKNNNNILKNPQIDQKWFSH